MLQLLGIDRTRRGLQSSGTSPMSATMTEDKVDMWPQGYADVIPKPRPPRASTTLPELMVCKDGTKVTDAKTWLEKRRPEIVEDFEREVYGRIPKDFHPKVTWTVTRDVVNGNVHSKTITGHIDNSDYPQITVGDITVSLNTPFNAKGPVPVVLTFGGGGGGGGGGAPGGGGGRGGRGGGRGAPPATAPGAAAPGARLDFQSIFNLQDNSLAFDSSRESLFDVAAPGGGRGGAGGGDQSSALFLTKGWGTASIGTGFQPGDWHSGVIGLAAKGRPRQPDEWGTLRAWGWGASRAIDYFETDKDVDAKAIALEGHSFLGKTTLVATIFEPRVFTAFVSSSGEGGAKIFRRNFGEPAEGIGGTSEYYWMDGNWLKYTGPMTIDTVSPSTPMNSSPSWPRAPSSSAADRSAAMAGRIPRECSLPPNWPARLGKFLAKGPFRCRWQACDGVPDRATGAIWTAADKR